MKENKVLFKENISLSKIYRMKDYGRGDKLPIISDTMFSTMINNEKRKKYASYLISLILDVDYNNIINNIQFMKDKLDKENYYEKGKTVELVCKINGEITNIELNNYKSVKSLERNLSYAFDLYKSSAKRSNPYKYEKVIQININNFSFKNHNKEIEKFMLKNEDGTILTDKIIIYNIYLPIIKKKCYTLDKLKKYERLLLVFNEKDNKLLKELSKGDEIMEEYVKDAYDASQDEEIIGLYDKELHEQMMHNTLISEAEEKGYNNGKNDGITQNKIEIAKNMLNKNMQIDLICEITGLTIEEIEKL